MGSGSSSSGDYTAREGGLRDGPFRRIGLLSVTALTLLGILPGVVSAHGGEHTPSIPQWYGLAVLLLGFGVLGGSVMANRRSWVASTERALAGVFFGIVVAALGGILLVELSPIDTYSTSSMLLPRAWFLPLALGFGLVLMVTSLILGLTRWPTRPRYMGLGVLLGLWIAYPALIRGFDTYYHPIGYVIALAVPMTVGYIIWRDGRDILREVVKDRVARRFGIGVGGVVTVFFMFSTGLISFVPEDGVINGVESASAPGFIAIAPAANPLVMWPAVQIWIPEIPFSGFISVGTLLIVGLLGGLVAVNASVAAFQWLYADGSGSKQSTAGAAALVGPNACGCCGPMFAQLAVVLVGPPAAMPLYWLFVDLSSPVGALFFVGSVALLTGGFVYAVHTLAPDLCEVSSRGEGRNYVIESD